MSLNEENDGEDPSKLSVAQNVQDELVRVIHMSLNNIASQVDNLNKHAEGVLGALSKEVDKVSCRYDTLHDCVTQLNNNITEKDTEKEFPLQAKKSKSSRSACIQTDLEYPFIPLPAKICETHDASVQTSPLFMSVPNLQDNPQVVPVLSIQEDTESVQIPYHQDDSDDLAIPPCQENEQNVEIPCCVASDQGLAASHDISYFKTCEEKLVAGVNEQVQERFRKKNQHVDHPCEPKCIHKITLMENDITVGHIPPTYIEIPHSHENPSTTECSAFSTYPIKEISKALTQAVGKVFASPPCLQRREVKYMKNSKPYVRYGVGKSELNVQSKVQIRPKPEVSVSRNASVTPPPLPHDWLTVLKDSNTECPASNVHSQTQFPSPVLRTSATTHFCNYLETSPETGVETTEEDNNEFPFLTLPPECLEIVEDNSPEEDNIIERMPLMSSPVLLRRTETKGKDSDLLIHTSFVQSPSSLEHLSSKTLFPQSPRLSASNSPRPSAISTPRFSHQPQTKYICPTYSKTSNSALPRHSTLEAYQSSFPLSESFLQASVHSARCQSAYSSKRSVSPRHFDTQSSRFSIPSSRKIYINQATEKLGPPSPQSASLKSKSFTLQSLFSFPKSTSPRIPNPQTLSVLQYSADPMSPDPKRTSVFNKERGTFLDSITKGVLLRKTEEHCILKAKIEISKK